MIRTGATNVSSDGESNWQKNAAVIGATSCSAVQRWPRFRRSRPARRLKLLKRSNHQLGRQPNILVIMGDDVGWFNIGAYHRASCRQNAEPRQARSRGHALY
jgi:hypothetical protein